MKITEIKIRKTFENEKLKAIVSITFDNELAVHDIKIIENDGKTFLAMPSRKMINGEYKDTVHPINYDFRKEVEDSVLYQYRNNLS